MQLIQLLRLQKAHDQNRQLMRFMMMPLLSCARAAIVMFQTVQSWIGPSYFSCRRLENLSGGLGSQIDASEGVHKIPRCDYGDPPGTHHSGRWTALLDVIFGVLTRNRSSKVTTKFETVRSKHANDRLQNIRCLMERDILEAL